MAEICPVCGLPVDLCVCEEMSKEQQRIRIRLENRRWGKKYTVIDGIDSKEMKLNEALPRTSRFFFKATIGKL
jgi:translation initiation factor 1